MREPLQVAASSCCALLLGPDQKCRKVFRHPVWLWVLVYSAHMTGYHRLLFTPFTVPMPPR
jgi:hypothetical protein